MAQLHSLIPNRRAKVTAILLLLVSMHQSHDLLFYETQLLKCYNNHNMLLTISCKSYLSSYFISFQYAPIEQSLDALVGHCKTVSKTKTLF